MLSFPAGYYYEIPSIGAIRINTQVYDNVPLAHKHDLSSIIFKCNQTTLLTGVPGCVGQTHGESRQKSKKCAVDQRLRGCTGTSTLT